MIDRRDDFLDSRVAERLKRFEVHRWEVHLVEDDFPVIGPKLEEYPVKQLECVSGIHDGFPVFLADLRVLFGNVFVSEVFVYDRVLGDMLDRAVLDFFVGGAKVFLLPKEILGEHFGPSAAPVLVDETVILDDNPFPESGSA